MSELDVVNAAETAARPVVLNEAVAGAGRTGDRAPGGTSREELVSRAQGLADSLAAAVDHSSEEFLPGALRQMQADGLLTAALPVALGGAGLGTEPGGHLPLLRILSAIGGGDLSLARLYEGHINALILVATYGSSAQIEQAAKDAHAGMLFGVWNTGHPEAMRLEAAGDTLRLVGGKTFCSGASVVQRPIITAELPGGGWQMILLRMEAPEIAGSLALDETSWAPLGMEGSGSYTVGFSGGMIARSDLLGAPGDFYRDPLFRGGAVRFAAVHGGATVRLFRMFAEWLDATGRDGDPYQIARLGEMGVRAQEAVLWSERAAAMAERGFSLKADKLAAERMVEFAGMMRVAIERGASAVMALIAPGVGARGLLEPHRFERLLRDLTMYLRQPAPDETLAEIGRATMRTLRLHGELIAWQQDARAGSLTAAYFDSVYANSADPWDFETSEYEAAKYADTLASLPQQRFPTALEVGCSIGVLTAQLAKRCDALLAVDVSERALQRARARCVDDANVRFERLQIPREMPDGKFELILISEVAYYWQRNELEQAATLLAERQGAGDTVVLVHLTETVPDYPLTGEQAHDAWLARPEWRVRQSARRARYRLDVLERV